MDKKIFIEKHFSELIDGSKYFESSKKRFEIIKSDLDQLINSVKEECAVIAEKTDDKTFTRSWSQACETIAKAIRNNNG